MSADDVPSQNEAAIRALNGARQDLTVAETLLKLNRREDALACHVRARGQLCQCLALEPMDRDASQLLVRSLYQTSHFAAAARSASRPDPGGPMPRLSVIIAALDRQAGAHHSLDGLLEDLRDFSGEVIVVFNDPELGEQLRDHKRIDKWAILSANAGVARAWNIGINLAQADLALILNADLRVNVSALEQLAAQLAAIPNGAMAGVAGERVDPVTLEATTRLYPGQFTTIESVDKITGYVFALHLQRLHDAGIAFDPRLSPYFFEELDMMTKCRAAGLRAYAMPISPDMFSHEGGISQRDRPIRYFGQLADRTRVIAINAARIFARLNRLGRP
jgi:hypothetical protein